MNQMVDFDQTYTETPLGHGKEIIRFWWLELILIKFCIHIDIDDLAQGITKCLLS